MTNEQSYINEQIKDYMEIIPYEKYAHPGVYSITVNGEIVYVGKARNMLKRIATHLWEINDGKQTTEGKKFKYGELKKAKKYGYDICFDVLYISSFSCEDDTIKIDDDIGPQEAKYINKFLPKLNKQIPNLNNYHQYKNKNYEHLSLMPLELDN